MHKNIHTTIINCLNHMSNVCKFYANLRHYPGLTGVSDVFLCKLT